MRDEEVRNILFPLARGGPTPMHQEQRVHFNGKSFFDISVEPDDKRLAIHFSRGNGVPMCARNYKGFTGCRGRWFFQVNFNEEFVIFDLHFESHGLFSFSVIEYHFTRKGQMCQ